MLREGTALKCYYVSDEKDMSTICGLVAGNLMTIRFDLLQISADAHCIQNKMHSQTHTFFWTLTKIFRTNI